MTAWIAYVIAAAMLFGWTIALIAHKCTKDEEDSSRVGAILVALVVAVVPLGLARVAVLLATVLP